ETLEDPLRFRVIRKDIARMKTILRERQGARGASATATRASR
ncbi:MAG TPA: 50S ribosomal protein L29, partial [Gemmatimonadaceae bacterium]|nr:50S ribosomal protein L29 [Gemmatimonadaceae bacterium]HET7623469.1 50S ribosomal protein L29 [Gemmatimonadaceae bacterium]